MLRIIVLFVFFLLSANVHAQLVNNKLFGGSAEDVANCIQGTSDGGFIVAGTSNSNDGDVSGNHGDYDVWIIKIDSGMNLQWQRSYGGSLEDRAMSLALTSDNGYILAGTTKSNDGEVNGNHNSPTGDYWIIKLDSAGHIQWQKCLGGTQHDEAASILQTPEGGYVIAGTSYSSDGDVTAHLPQGNVSSIANYWIVKLDSAGTLLWERSVEKGQARSILETSSGGFVVTGIASTNKHLTIKLDSLGNTVWQKTVLGDTKGHAIIQNTSGDYIVAGTITYRDCDYFGGCSNIRSDFHLTRLDSSGNILWHKGLHTSGTFDEAYAVVESADGGYLITGRAGHDGSDGDCMVFKTDETGRELWSQKFYGSGNEHGNSIVISSSGRYVVAGFSRSTNGDLSGNHGGSDFWVFEAAEPVCNINPVVTPSGTINMCLGDTVMLTVTGNGIAPALHTIIETGSYSYGSTVNVAHGTCTQYTPSVSVTTNPSCSISGVATVCLGDASMFTASGGALYAWSGPNGFVASTDTTGSITEPGIYTVTVTDTNGCARSCSKTLSSAAPCTISGTTDICTEDSTSFSAAINGLYYSWSGPVGFTANTHSTGKINTPGTYSLTMTDSTGCTRVCSRNLSHYNPLHLHVLGDTAICSNQTTDLYASVTNDPCYTYQNSYSWSGPDGFAKSSSSTGVISTPGIYSVTVTNCRGCTTTRSVLLTSSGPTCSIIGDTLLCPNEHTSLEATGGTSYIWAGPNGFIAFTANTGSITVAGTYVLTASDTNGCSSTCSKQILRSALHQGLFPIEGNTNICANEFTTFTYDSSNSSGSNYLWSGPQGFTAGTFSTGPINTQGNYTLTVTDSFGCTASFAKYLSHKSLPACGAEGERLLCSGSTTSLTASGGVSYEWSGPDQFTSHHASTGAIGESGNYFVTVTGVNGCKSSCGFTVTKLLPVTASVHITDATCYGAADGTAQVIPNGGKPPFSVMFTEPGVPPFAAGEYHAVVVDSYGCSGTASFTINQPDALSITIDSIVHDNGLYAGAVTISISGGTPPFIYQWSNGATTQNLAEIPFGSYTVTVADAHECSASLENIVVELTNGITLESKESLLLFPNPANDKFTVIVPDGSFPITRISIANITGKEVLQSTEATVSIKTLVPGIYFVKVEFQTGRSRVRKMVVQ